MNSRFIVLEGSEGVGKSSHIKTIENYLIKYKIDYILTREPGGTKTGEEIRKIILDKENETDELSDALLFYASRYENYTKKILPALNTGKTVICDRFHYSTLVYQGIVGNNSTVRDLHIIFDEMYKKSIDHVIYFYTDPEESLKRISSRPVTDKFESKGLSFLEEISEAYKNVFKKMKNITMIDTSGDKRDTEKVLSKSLDEIFIKND
ncbi:MAG: dTMP kinase [Gammaproteobacteria bacterium]|jgi:dTMP kinase|nr:dTMP kinase [Gammaproteobacteria bacterium]